MGGEGDAQRDRKGQHPLARRYPRDDALGQVSRALHHAPGATAIEKILTHIGLSPQPPRASARRVDFFDGGEM